MSATVPYSGRGSIVKMVSNNKAKLKNIIVSPYHNTCHYYSFNLEEHVHCSHATPAFCVLSLPPLL